MEEIHLPADAYLYRMGDEASDFYVVLEGTLLLRKDYTWEEDSRRLREEDVLVIARVSESFEIGEIGLLDDRHLVTSSYVADGPVRLLKLPRAAFKRLAAVDPELEVKLQLLVQRYQLIHPGAGTARAIAAQSPERRVAAAMFTDIVGSTAATSHSEPAGFRIRARHRLVVQDLVGRNGGRFIEAPGDESLSTFDRVPDSVRCAVGITRTLEADPELQLRIGIAAGEIEFRPGEVFGNTVNIAARVQALAEPGEILVTDDVRYAIGRAMETWDAGPFTNLRSSPRGAHRLKGVSHPVALFAIEPG